MAGVHFVDMDIEELWQYTIALSLHEISKIV